MNLPANLFDGDVSVQVILCQPDKTRIGEIIPYDKKGTFKFNSYSEISFSVDRYYNDMLDGSTKINPYYNLIDSLRVIELRGIGHFVIQDVDENIGETESKSVTAFSLEYSTGQKYLENFYVNTGEEGSVETMYHARQYGAEYSIDNYYTLVNKSNDKFDEYERYYIKEYSNDNGVSYNYVETQILNKEDYQSYEFDLYVKKYPNVRFYWPTKPGLSLLHLVFSLIPEWKIGHVDKELWYEERTFSEDRTAVYDFLYNTAAETLDFVMVWDSISGTVSFYKTTEDGVTADKEIETQWNTDVFVSRENLASEIDIQYSTDDIKTKLKITGADNLDIRDVNLGQNYIMNLSFYNTDLWLGKDLHTKYDQYTTYLAEKTAEYKNLMSDWSAAYNEYSDLMNYVPVEPSVLLIGDKFETLYCTYGLIKATKYIEGATYYDAKGNKVSPTQNVDGGLDGDYYINTIENPISELKKHLGLYRVGIDGNGDISEIDKTDDVLLTLTNNNSDSATIRVKCIKKGLKYENYEYKIYRTLTTASSGLSVTEEYSIDDWVKGNLTADQLGLTKGGKPDFTVKSIGTLGAYLCLAKDETKKENVEDYGIRLLKEKQDVYTKIFITQTEGYMSKEGSRCVAQDTEPEGASVGDKWLDSSSDNAEVKIWNGKNWERYSVNDTNGDNSADFENYTRFIDNYDKLQVVQEVLSEKQQIADYLLNGIAVNELYLTADSLNLNSLLRAATMHHIVLKNDYVISESEPSSEYRIEGMIWFQYIPYTSHISIYKYVDKKWVPQSSDSLGFQFNAILTDYFVDATKNYGYATYIFDPAYEKAEKFSENDIYFIEGTKEVNGITVATYNKFYAQPQNDSDVFHTYVGNIADGVTIAKNTVCYFTIGNNRYTFIAPYDLNKDSVLICNPNTNKLTVGITTSELTKYSGDAEDTTNLSFTKVEYWIAKGLEYAVYATNGTPYVSYARSRGMCSAQMNYIKELTDMNNYFSKEELMRLSPFIREDEYSDDNFLLTSYESEEEEMYIKQSLLEAGIKELEKICQPKLSFSATMANLLAIPEFEPLRRQFKLGNFIKIGIREGYVKRARLLEVQINFEDASDFSCTFGDLITTKSEIDKHADLLSQAVTVSKQVASHASNWQKGANKATTLDQAINEGLRDAALSVGAADGQAITWDRYGIRGRKLIDGTTDQYHDEQFALINNKLAFTTDNWKTSKAVVGEFEVEIPNEDNSATTKQTMYGLLADALVGGYIQGTDIVGGTLKIGDGTENLFLVDEKGNVTIKQGGKNMYDAISTIDAAYKYSIQLTYTGDAVFSDPNETATITAKIFRRAEDATQYFKRQGVKVHWIRSSNENDTDWMPSSISSDTYQITINNSDVPNTAQISCYIDASEEDVNAIEENFND